MTPWLSESNRAALATVLPYARLKDNRWTQELIVKDGVFYLRVCYASMIRTSSSESQVGESQAACILNMAALAYIEAHTPTWGVVLRMGAGKSVTEQIIEAVRVWADGGDTVDRVDGEEGKA